MTLMMGAMYDTKLIAQRFMEGFLSAAAPPPASGAGQGGH